jgi:hypothetical protein
MLNSLHTDAAFHPVRSFSIALREGLLAWGSGHHVYARTGIRNLKHRARVTGKQEEIPR